MISYRTVPIITKNAEALLKRIVDLQKSNVSFISTNPIPGLPDESTIDLKELSKILFELKQKNASKTKEMKLSYNPYIFLDEVKIAIENKEKELQEQKKEEQERNENKDKQEIYKKSEQEAFAKNSKENEKMQSILALKARLENLDELKKLLKIIVTKLKIINKYFNDIPLEKIENMMFVMPEDINAVLQSNVSNNRIPINLEKLKDQLHAIEIAIKNVYNETSLMNKENEELIFTVSTLTTLNQLLGDENKDDGSPLHILSGVSKEVKRLQEIKARDEKNKEKAKDNKIESAVMRTIQLFYDMDFKIRDETVEEYEKKLRSSHNDANQNVNPIHLVSIFKSFDQNISYSEYKLILKQISTNSKQLKETLKTFDSKQIENYLEDLRQNKSKIDEIIKFQNKLDSDRDIVAMEQEKIKKDKMQKEETDRLKQEEIARLKQEETARFKEDLQQDETNQKVDEKNDSDELKHDIDSMLTDAKKNLDEISSLTEKIFGLHYLTEGVFPTINFKIPKEKFGVAHLTFEQFMDLLDNYKAAINQYENDKKPNIELHRKLFIIKHFLSEPNNQLKNLLKLITEPDKHVEEFTEIKKEISYNKTVVDLGVALKKYHTHLSVTLKNNYRDELGKFKANLSMISEKKLDEYIKHIDKVNGARRGSNDDKRKAALKYLDHILDDKFDQIASSDDYLDSRLYFDELLKKYLDVSDSCRAICTKTIAVNDLNYTLNEKNKKGEIISSKSKIQAFTDFFNKPTTTNCLNAQRNAVTDIFFNTIGRILNFFTKKQFFMSEGEKTTQKMNKLLMSHFSIFGTKHIGTPNPLVNDIKDVQRWLASSQHSRSIISGFSPAEITTILEAMILAARKEKNIAVLMKKPKSDANLFNENCKKLYDELVSRKNAEELGSHNDLRK